MKVNARHRGPTVATGLDRAVRGTLVPVVGMLGACPAWARNKGCTVACEFWNVAMVTGIALFFLYGLLVLNTHTRISPKKSVAYCGITVAVAALVYGAAEYGLGLSAWPSALAMGFTAVAVFVFLFNPRRHRPTSTDKRKGR